MKTLINKLRKWLPALLVMGLIFWFSSQPSSNLPNFDWADRIFKKGSHMLGYGLLSLAYWYAMDMKPNNRWFAWFLAILYAITDEYHQSFVTGRYALVSDVFVFDNLGALISLQIKNRTIKQKQSGQFAPDRFLP